MDIKNLPLSERPIEKILRVGPRGLNEKELLSILVHTGTPKQQLFETVELVMDSIDGNLRTMFEVEGRELMEIPGIGKQKAAVILAAFELGRRACSCANKCQNPIQDAKGAALYVMEDLRYKRKENFVILLLDVKGKVISMDWVSEGELSSSIVHPREVFKKAVKRSAARIILAHNHPSGDPTPSKEDIKITRRLVEAGNILGITVLDHIIIGDGNYVSLADQGNL